MAGGWDKIKNKLEQGRQGPKPADWEAMNAKIQAHPQLASASRGLWYKALSVLLILCLAGASWWYFSSEPTGRQPAQQQQKQQHTPAATSRGNEGQEAVPGHGPNMGGNDNAQAKERDAGEQVANSAPENDTKKIAEAATLGDDENRQPKRDDTFNAPLTKPENPQQKSVAGQQEESTETKPYEGAEEHIASGNPQEEDKVAPQRQKLPGKEAGEVPEALSAELKTNLETGLALNIKTKPDPEINSEQKLSDSAEAFGESESELAASNSADEEFYQAGSGFKLASLNMGAKYLGGIGQNALQGWQFGADVSLKRNNWQLNTGLYYGIGHIEEPYQQNKLELALDSSYRQEVTTRTVQEIRRYWIIDSFFQGHWENDTVLINISDTNQILQVDTTRIEVVENKLRNYSLTYVEMPILTGYSFNRGKYQLNLLGGVALNQLVRTLAEAGAEESFGLGLLLQPAFRYRLAENYSIYARTGWRYNLLPNAAMQSNVWVYDIQLGIAVEW